jgi:hypothetical protein
MHEYQYFLKNTLDIKDRVLSDSNLKEEIIATIQKGPNKYDGHAFYKSIIPFDIGIKRRDKEYQNHKFEVSVNGYLWNSDMPFSPYMLIVHEEEDFLWYLMHDFGPLSKPLLSDEVYRIKDYTESKGIEISSLAMGGTKKGFNGWNTVVMDLDSIASFCGGFDRDKSKIFSSKFDGSKIKKWNVLHEIYDSLTSPKYRLNLL